MPKAVLCGELSMGKRDKGSPWKRFEDQAKWPLSECIDHRSWDKMAFNRDGLRRLLTLPDEIFAEGKRQRRKKSQARLRQHNIY